MKSHNHKIAIFVNPTFYIHDLCPEGPFFFEE